MAKKTPIDQIIEKAVSGVLEDQLPDLRKNLVRRVLEEVQPHLGGSAGSAGKSAGSGAADLLHAVSAIHAGTTQKEILRALLESTAGYCGRAALFVIKAGAATGWQGRGFDNNEDLKDFPLDVSSKAPAQVLQARAAVSAASSDMDPRFISQFGAPAEDQVLLMPLRLKDKVAALVYADAGTGAGEKMDAAAVELLVAATSAWLEVASLRKQALKEGTAEAGAGEKFEAPPVQTVSSFSDPFAGHAPKHAVAQPVAVEEPAMAEATAEVVTAPAAMSAAAAAPATDAFAHMSAGGCRRPPQGATFRAAVDGRNQTLQSGQSSGRPQEQRFVRSPQGRHRQEPGHLPEALRQHGRGQHRLPQPELIRSLAEDDVSILGPNFRH